MSQLVNICGRRRGVQRGQEPCNHSRHRRRCVRQPLILCLTEDKHSVAALTEAWVGFCANQRILNEKRADSTPWVCAGITGGRFFDDAASMLVISLRMLSAY